MIQIQDKQYRVFGIRWCLALAVLFCSDLFALSAVTAALPAQPAAQSPAADTPQKVMSQLRETLAETQAKYTRFLASFENTTNLPPGATQAEVVEFGSLLKNVIQTHQSHLNDLAAIETLRQRVQDFQRTARSWTGFSEPPPYSVLLVDELRDSVQSLKKKVKISETGQAFLEKLVTDIGTRLETSEGKVRRLNEQLEKQADSPLGVRLMWLRELEQTRCQSAAASVSTLETKREKTIEELDENRQRLAFAQQQLTIASQNMCFKQEDLDKAIQHIADAKARLKTEELPASARLEKSQQNLTDDRAKLQRALQNTDQAFSDPRAIRKLQDIVETRNTQVQANTEILTCIRQLLRGLDTEQQLWQMRFLAFSKHDPSEMQEAYRRLDKLADLIQAAKPFYTQQIELTNSQIAEQQNSLLNASGSQSNKDLTLERLAAFQQQAVAYRRVQEGLEKNENLVQQWKEEIDGDRKIQPLNKKIQDVRTRVANAAASAWNFELFVVKDTITVGGQEITGQRGIPVGKIILACLILLIGYGISKNVARRLETLSIRHLKIEPNQANLIRRWSHVIFVVVLVIFSLVSVKIPLTIFAFAGGALAIGIGFGTQNLLKNFISGIIILFERPFRVGDVLDVAGLRGKVTSIGIRASVVRLWDGTENLIPNSTLLENNLTNWTYSNGTVRFVITVGVAYGSDTRRVAQLLSEVADRHGLVMKDPKPLVVFNDFGDNSLSFNLLYWVEVLKCNFDVVASDIRHMIDRDFLRRTRHCHGVPSERRASRYDDAPPCTHGVIDDAL